jgi:outer membrane protein assembly factor BamD
LIPLIFIFFSGCADKDPESNQPAIYWYQKIVKDAGRGNLDGAGGYYTSLQGEHIRSPLLGEAMLIMANAHMKAEEYLLANYYYDEYIKRFGTKETIPYIKFLKLKANYYGLKNPKRDQKLILDTKESSGTFAQLHPDSVYEPFAQAINTNIVATEDRMNADIAALYEKIDKPEGAEFYRAKNASSFVTGVTIEEPEISWFRALFE